jgi:hypothetical protein
MLNVLEIEGNFTLLFSMIRVATRLGAGTGMGLYDEKREQKNGRKDAGI